MRKTLTLMVVLFAIALLAAPPVMAKGPLGTGKTAFFHYLYQWLRDDDGDGVPNCQDPDYTKPENGTGYGKNGESGMMKKYQRGYSNGDGEWYLYRYRHLRGECTGENQGECTGPQKRGR